MIVGFSAEGTEMCNLGGQVHWNRFLVWCQLSVAIVVLISEALYFIPVENCVNKLHYVSYFKDF